VSAASGAYDALHRAMSTTAPGCAGLDLFTADDLTKADIAVLVPICEACPINSLCRDYATAARPPAGFWAGKKYTTRPKTTTDRTPK